MSFRAISVRFLLGIVLFGSIMFAPPYVPALIALGLCLRFRAWEVVVAGLVMDLLWLPAAAFSGMRGIPIATILALFLVVGLEPLRRRLLVDER